MVREYWLSGDHLGRDRRLPIEIAPLALNTTLTAKPMSTGGLVASSAGGKMRWREIPKSPSPHCRGRPSARGFSRSTCHPLRRKNRASRTWASLADLVIKVFFRGERTGLI